MFNYFTIRKANGAKRSAASPKSTRTNTILRGKFWNRIALKILPSTCVWVKKFSQIPLFMGGSGFFDANVLHFLFCYNYNWLKMKRLWILNIALRVSLLLFLFVRASGQKTKVPYSDFSSEFSLLYLPEILKFKPISHKGTGDQKSRPHQNLNYSFIRKTKVVAIGVNYKMIQYFNIQKLPCTYYFSGETFIRFTRS